MWTLGHSNLVLSVLLQSEITTWQTHKLLRWEHTASIFRTEYGGSMFFRNVGIYLQVHMALQPRRPTFSSEDGGSMFPLNIGIYLQVHTALQPRRPTSTFHRRDNLKSELHILFFLFSHLSTESLYHFNCLFSLYSFISVSFLLSLYFLFLALYVILFSSNYSSPCWIMSFSALF
jgi:hypothetical protein